MSTDLVISQTGRKGRAFKRHRFVSRAHKRWRERNERQMIKNGDGIQKLAFCDYVALVALTFLILASVLGTLLYIQVIFKQLRGR